MTKLLKWDKNRAIEIVQQLINFEIEQKLALTSLAWSLSSDLQDLHPGIEAYLMDRAPQHYLLFALSIQKP